MTLEEKKKNLTEKIKGYGKVAVAFSGGVDSTLLLKLCLDILGKDNVFAITASASAIPKRESEEANDFCKANNIKQIEFFVDQMAIDEFRQNEIDRCYFCKKEIFSKMREIASEQGTNNIVEGSNFDDTYDFRPGMKALRELNINSPLMECELTKNEIRLLSKELDLKTATKSSFACLATRFEYNQEITEEKLKSVYKAEQFLFDNGFNQVRVRVHNNIARIEVPKEDIEKIAKLSKDISDNIKSLGFDYVTLDLTGYHTGSMNINILKV